MSAHPSRWRAALLAAGLLLAGAWPAAAQIPDALRSPDSLRADSIRADSLKRLRQQEYAERYVEQQGKGDVRLPVVPLGSPPGPAPAGSRIVFARDTIEWMQAQTLGDLLAQVPGTYLWRGGWIGAAELPNYRARGAGAVEYVLDGLPYVALGTDSLSVDPLWLPLSLLDRVEIETAPGTLRVFLTTRRNDRLAARSLIGLGRGTNSLTKFEAQLELRNRGGLLFGLAADYYNTGEVPTVSTSSDFYRNTALWVQLGYVPSARKGVVAQLLRGGPRRLSITGDEAAPDAVDGRRNDYLLRGFLRSRDDGLGTGFDLFLGYSAWDGADVEIQQSVGHVGGAFSLRGATSSASLSAAWRSRWTPLDARAQVSWSPVNAVALRGEAAYQLHSESRTAAWAGGSVSIALLGPIKVQGSARAGSILLTPAIAAAEAQDVVDLSGAVVFETKPLMLQAGITRTDAFQPTPFPTFSGSVQALAPVPNVKWFTVKGRFTPVNWLSVQGWFDTPLDVTPEGQPIDHLVGDAEIRSKFLRKFPSGAFDLRASIGWERWGVGVMGTTPDGVALNQVSQNYFRFRIQLAIQSFTAYWERYNMNNQVTGYVPGLPMGGGSQIFGVRWGFLN